MAKLAARAPHMPWISPYLIVKNAATAIAFYEKAFNFTRHEVVNDDKGEIMHAELAYQDGVIMIGPEGCPGNPLKSPASSGQGCPLSLYVYCEDVDLLCNQAKKCNANVLAPPEDMFWGDRICRIQDPEGYIWCFATHTGEHKPSPFKK